MLKLYGINTGFFCMASYLTVFQKAKFVQVNDSRTVDGGKLREAASRKDHRVLAQILGKDCVAIEVKYHVHCYKSYTSFLTRPSTHGSTLQKDKVTKYIMF